MILAILLWFQLLATLLMPDVLHLQLMLVFMTLVAGVVVMVMVSTKYVSNRTAYAVYWFE